MIKFLIIFIPLITITFLLLFSASIYTYLKIGEISIYDPILFFLYLTLYIAALSSITLFFSSIASRSISSLILTITLHIILLYTGNSPFSLYHHINTVIDKTSLIIPISIFILFYLSFFYISLFLFQRRDL